MSENPFLESLKKADEALGSNDPDTCIDNLLDVLRYNPKDINANYLMGVAQEQQHDKKAAFAYFRDAAVLFEKWFRMTSIDPSEEKYMTAAMKFQTLLDNRCRNEDLDVDQLLQEHLQEITDKWGEVVYLIKKDEQDRTIDHSYVADHGKQKLVICYNTHDPYYGYEVAEELCIFNLKQEEMLEGRRVLTYDYRKDGELSSEEKNSVTEDLLNRMHHAVERKPLRILAEALIWLTREEWYWQQQAVMLDRLVYEVRYYKANYNRIPERMRGPLIIALLVDAAVVDFQYHIDLSKQIPATEEEKKAAAMIFKRFRKIYDFARLETGCASQYAVYYAKKIGYAVTKAKVYDEVKGHEDAEFTRSKRMLEDAMKDAQKALDEERTPFNYLQKAKIEILLGYKEDGLEDTLRALEIVPEYPDALAIIVQCCKDVMDAEVWEMYRHRLQALLMKRPELEDDYDDILDDY